jgi:hypothetical protein
MNPTAGNLRRELGLGGAIMMGLGTARELLRSREVTRHLARERVFQLGDRTVMEVRGRLGDVAEHRNAELVAVGLVPGHFEAADVLLLRAGGGPVLLGC